MPTPYLRLLFFLMVISGILPLAQAQEPLNDSDFLEGNRLWIAGHYDSAYGFYERAEAAARDSQNDELLAYALGARGRYLSRMGQPQEAVPFLDTTLTLVDSLHPAAFLARRDRAHILMLSGDFDGGLVAHQANADMAEGLPANLDSIKAVCFHVLGNAFLILDDYEQSTAYCKRAMEIRERILPPDHVYLAFGENSLGSILMWEEKYEESYKHLKRSAEILESNFGPSHPQVLKIKTNIAILHTDLGERWEALSVYKECVPYLDKMQPDGAIITLLNMGSNYMTLGDFEESLNTFDLAEQYHEQYPKAVSIAQAYIDSERAHILTQIDRLDEALGFIIKAIKKKEELFGDDGEDLLLDYLKKGQILNLMKRFKEASKAYEYAVFLGEKYLAPHAIYRAQSYEYYAASLSDQGKQRAARAYLKKAEQAYMSSEVRWNLADVYTRIADTWLQESGWDSVHIYHKKAWEIIEEKAPYGYGNVETLLPYWEMGPVKGMLQSMAATARARYQEDGKRPQLKAALFITETSIGVTDSLRHYLETAASRDLSMRYLVPEYEEAISMCMELYEAGEGDEYLERAFVLAEKSKAANLRDHIRSLSALSFAGLPAELVAQERDYRQQLAELALPEADKDDMSERRLLNIEYRTFLKKIENEYPAYYKLKYHGTSVKPSEVLEKLPPKHCMYSYFWGDKHLFIFKLYEHRVSLFRVDLQNSKLPSKLETWLTQLTLPENESGVLDSELPKMLFQLLLPEFEDGATSLSIIPDGKLGYLPFETLVTGDGEAGQLRSWPWLWRNAATSYAYAAELWLEQTQKKEVTSADYLGFAPDFGSQNFTTTRRAFGPLEFNQYEVTMAAKALRGKALTGAEASEEAIKKLRSDGKILHFATHAIANDSSEMSSRLILAPSADSSEDGQLYAWEIYGLTLPSPLTVLSACQTGTGPLHRGEGVMSLARAFQYAGSERVLTTLWHTDDKASADISSSFFEALAEGAATDQALQGARASYIESSDNAHAHPRYWGAFVMIGDQGEIAVRRSGGWFGWALGGLLVLLVFVGIRRERRS